MQAFTRLKELDVFYTANEPFYEAISFTNNCAGTVISVTIHIGSSQAL